MLKMITTSASREREVINAAKQELAGNSTTTANGKNSNSKASSSSTTTPWSTRLKDPRIVRVSRAFGGKDRHSKVCTVRGLRDRRVRLSVSTAIQLYDLQDRLGLNQPSKAVDWLLNAAKHEIDELPPLQMPPGNFGIDDQQLMLANHAANSKAANKQGVKMISSGTMDCRDHEPILGGGVPVPVPVPAGLNFWNSSNAKSKDVATKTDDIEREDWSTDQRNEKEKGGSDHLGLGGDEDTNINNVSSTNFFLRPNQLANSSIPGLLNNAVPYINPIYRWDPSNFSLSQMGSHGYAPQTEDQYFHNFNVVPLAPLPSGSHQVLVCPPQAGTTTTTQLPYFPSHVATPVDLDPKLQMSHFHMLMGSSSQNPSSNMDTPTVPTTTLYSIGQSIRPLHFSMVSKHFSSQDASTASQSHNDAEFPSK